MSKTEVAGWRENLVEHIVCAIAGALLRGDGAVGEVAGAEGAGVTKEKSGAGRRGGRRKCRPCERVKLRIPRLVRPESASGALAAVG